ncbi:YIP1 family protein [Mycobacteroides abscessus]|nr:YIP1 family protein [Mycobacteroides abscessus]
MVLVVVAVAGLHHLARVGDAVGELLVWGGLLLGWFTALGGGVKLAAWGLKPVTTGLFDTAKTRVSEPARAVIAALAVLAGASGLWWVLRGGYPLWWQQLSGTSGWTFALGAGQMLIAVLSGAALFTGGRFLTGLVREVLTGVGGDDGAHRSASAPKSPSHPALVAALVGGGVALVVMTAWLVPVLLSAITGSSMLPAAGAIALVLVWAVGANLGWWQGLAGLFRWATAATNKATAVAGVVALLAFSAGGLGLGWFTTDSVPLARAACPPDCGGPGGDSYGPPGGGQMFQPPSQGGPQMPDYQGGFNQSPMDQNSGISIYNTNAPGAQQVPSQTGGQQQEPPFRANPDGSWQARNGEWSPPDYQTATPFTQGPGRPNPDFPGNQGAQHGGQPNQGVQQPVQQAPQQQQPAQQQPQQPNQGAQQPQQSPDQQRVEDLTRQLNEQQQQNGQSQQRIDELTKQLNQQKQQQNNNQKLPRLPENGKKKNDQQDRDNQSGNNDLAALLLGAASTTRRRKQDDPEQQGQQGPDTQALTHDGGQLASGLPSDIANTVSDGVNLGQSAGSAAQGFGSAASAGASIASSAQSGAVNPQDAIAVVQGVSQGIQGTADAVNSGAQITSTWLENSGEAAQLAADVNPQLKPQAQQIQQLSQAGGQVANLTGQAASGVSQVSGMVNTASSLGTSGLPDTSGVAADVQSVDLQSGQVPEGVATAVDFKQAPADPAGPDVPEPPIPSRVSQMPSAQQMKSMTDMEILGLSKEAQAALTAYDAQFPEVIPQPQYQAYLDGRAPLVAVKEAYDAQLASRGITFGPLGGEVQYNQQTGSILRFRDYPAKPGDPTPPWKELGTPEPLPSVPQEPPPSLTEPPTSVSGYRGHAMDRMQERGWTRGQVEDAVDNPKQPAIFQPDKGTWLYRGQNGINVAVNPYGEVVTVF